MLHHTPPYELRPLETDDLAHVLGGYESESYDPYGTMDKSDIPPKTLRVAFVCSPYYSWGGYFIYP